MTPRGSAIPEHFHRALPRPGLSRPRPSGRALRGERRSALQVLPSGCRQRAAAFADRGPSCGTTPSRRPRPERPARHRVAAIKAVCPTRHRGIGGPIPNRATRAAARLKGLEPVGGLGQGCPGREPRASPGSPGCAALDVLARATRELRRTTQPLGQLLA